MRANEFLNETELNELIAPTVGRSGQSITINIPANLFSPQSTEAVAEEREEEIEQEDIEVAVDEPTEPEGNDELADIVRLSGGGHTEPAQGVNHTIAAPAANEIPEDPVFISPLQQQLELQKQQGGKESPHINQIINHTLLGSTAGEQPEQSVYHDNPLKNNEFVGASTGAVDQIQNATTTKGADKPWYKL